MVYVLCNMSGVLCKDVPSNNKGICLIDAPHHLMN